MNTELEQVVDFVTIFVTKNGKQVGSHPALVPIQLYKGMAIKIHGCSKTYSVVDWSFNYDHSDQNPGLRIVLE